MKAMKNRETMKEPRAGAMLVEAMIALALLTIGILGFCSSFVSNARASGEVEYQDEVRVAVENVVELLRGSEFKSVYQNFQGSFLEVPTLEGVSGGSATAEVRFHINEVTLPMEFGPVLDIDGKPGLNTPDCSTTYKILPLELTLRYRASYGPEDKTLYILLGDNGSL